MTLKENEQLDAVLPLDNVIRRSRWPDLTMNFIIAYDVADPKRLKLAAKSWERAARRVQKSVFMFSGSRRELNGIINNLVTLIEPSEDRVQAWPIRTSTRACRTDAGYTVPDTGIASVIADDHWTIVEAIDDDHHHEPLILD